MAFSRSENMGVTSTDAASNQLWSPQRSHPTSITASLRGAAGARPTAFPNRADESQLLTNAEYLAFMPDDGYSRPELWLSDGWAACQAQGWSAPLYWAKEAGEWMNVTLAGLRPLDPAEPVCHVSYYEADAFARW